MHGVGLITNTGNAVLLIVSRGVRRYSHAVHGVVSVPSFSLDDSGQQKSHGVVRPLG